MSENKYHVSINGFLVHCSASKRACSRGGTHYTQEDYDSLAAKNDPVIRLKSTKHDPNSFYGKAEAAYVAGVKSLRKFDKIKTERNLLEKKLMKEKGLKKIDLHASQRNVAITLEETLTYARDVYVEEGVSYSKASFIVQDMKRNEDPTRPMTKRSDRIDPEINEKTKRAAARLKEDPNYSKLRESYVQAIRDNRATEDVILAGSRYQNDAIRNSGASGMPIIAQQEALEKAKSWMKAGVAPTAAEVSTSQITPDRVSIDSKGKINNLWVETPNGVERIVGYQQTTSTHGNLVTDKGTNVYSAIHYHSYKSTQEGFSKVILAEKDGPSYPAEKFAVTYSWDSGD